MASKNCCSVRHTSWCRVPKYSDTRRAHFKSTDPSNPIAYVSTTACCCCSCSAFCFSASCGCSCGCSCCCACCCSCCCACCCSCCACAMNFTTSAVTMELSKPPDNKQPTGRSLMRRLQTASSNKLRTSTHARVSRTSGEAFTSSSKSAVPKL